MIYYVQNIHTLTRGMNLQIVVYKCINNHIDLIYMIVEFNVLIVILYNI